MDKRIKNILRCYASGMGIKETVSLFCSSRNTVCKYVRLFLSSGKSIEQFLSLSDEQLHEIFGFPESRHREPSARKIEQEALLPGYVSRLTRKGTSIRKLFKEYHAEYPEGYQLSSFKRIAREYRFHIKLVGHVEHYAGDQMYVDFAGDRLEVVDEMTGERKKAEVFVAVLPFSHYTYCEAVWSQCKEMFLHGEKDYLRLLPLKRYILKERKIMTVGRNSYVSLFKHHYSVPKEYVGKRVTILYNADTVEIY